MSQQMCRSSTTPKWWGLNCLDGVGGLTLVLIFRWGEWNKNQSPYATAYTFFLERLCPPLQATQCPLLRR